MPSEGGQSTLGDMSRGMGTSLAGMSAGLPARLLLWALYPVGLRLFGFLAADELAELRSLLSARA